MPDIIPTKTAEEVAIDESAAQRTEDRLDTLFGVKDPAPQDDPKKKEKEEVIKDDAVKEGDDEEVDDDMGSEEEDETDSGEEDWDSPLKKPKSGDEEEEDEEDLSDKSAAAKQAQLRGREAKKLRTELTEKNLELERIKEENASLKARVEETEAVRIKPKDHPDYKKLHDTVLSDVRGSAELLSVDEPELLVNNFGPLMAEFLHMDSLSGNERSGARETLKGRIADALKLGGDIPYQDLDDDERKSHAGTLNEVFKIIQRNANNTRELQKLHDTLEQRAQSGRLALGVREYNERRSEFEPIVSSIGDLADDVIEADPHSMSSVVAKMAKENPEVRKRLDKAKEEVLEALIGPRALTQAELDKLADNGTDLKEFNRNREANHREKQKKLAAMFIQSLVLRSHFKEMTKELAELRGEKDADESELDTLRKVTRKKSKIIPPKDDKYRGPASSRPSAADKLFDTSDD